MLNDRALDIVTRCWRCRRLRYMDISHADVIVDDVWMCGGCVHLMDGWYRPPPSYVWHPALQSFVTSFKS